MVRFCNKCKRAMDDSDKFCRSCGNDAKDSIDYYTYYRTPLRDETEQNALLWFMRGKDIAIRGEMKNIREKVDQMYMKLFPPSAEELRKDLDKTFTKEVGEELEQEELEELGGHKDIETEKPLGIEEEKKEGSVEKGIAEKGTIEKEGVDEGINKGQDDIGIHTEVDDKLNGLLQTDAGQRDAVQYLIKKYKNKDQKIGDGIDSNKSSEVNGKGPGITIIPQEDVVRIGRARGKTKEKTEPYKMYDAAIHPFIPDILRSIESSKDGMIRVRLIDIAKKMGESFVDKKPVTIYSGLKYTLFDHKIVVEMGSLKEVDPVTLENVKILKMRMRNPDDKLPPSLLERRGETEE